MSQEIIFTILNLKSQKNILNVECYFRELCINFTKHFKTKFDIWSNLLIELSGTPMKHAFKK